MVVVNVTSHKRHAADLEESAGQKKSEKKMTWGDRRAYDERESRT
jgi:hypothetical protein